MTGKSPQFLLLSVMIAVLLVCGCGRDEAPQAEDAASTIERTLATQAHGLFLAIANNDKGYLQTYSALGLGDAVGGPLLIHDIAVLQVRQVDAETWAADYRLTLSDPASTAFNYLVRDDRLSPTMLAAYSKTASQLGRLTWRSDGKRLQLVAPTALEPLGVLLEHARARREWQETTKKVQPGLPATIEIVALLARLQQRPSLGIRPDMVLPEIARKLEEAEARGPMEVLAPTFLTTGQDRISRALMAVATLDRILSAWSNGNLAAHRDSLVELEGVHVDAAAFERTPVRIKDYAITGLDMREPHVFSIAAELTVSDPASVLGVTMCAGELASPFEQLEAIDNGARVRDAFYIARSDGQNWKLHYHRHQGTLGYALGTSRAMERFRRQYRSPISLMTAGDNNLWARELTTRFGLMQNEMADLDFGPVSRMLTANSEHGYLSEVVKKLEAITSEIRTLQNEPPRVLSFVLGSKLAEYFITAEMLARSGKTQPEAMEALRKEVVRYLRALAVPPQLAERIDDLLSRHKGVNDGQLQNISAEIRRFLQRSYDPEHVATYLVGFNMLHLVILSRYQDQLGRFEGSGKLISAAAARRVLGDLEYNMEVAHAHSHAINVIRTWNRTGERAIPSAADTAPIKSFDWFFSRQAPQDVNPGLGPLDTILD